eukprot:gene62482-85456_t
MHFGDSTLTQANQKVGVLSPKCMSEMKKVVIRGSGFRHGMAIRAEAALPSRASPYARSIRMAGYTPFQSQWFAHFLTREGLEGDGLAQSLSAARVDLNPHQVDAAMFALRSPLSKGVLLADEVGLGKTIEAALVLAQRWWERRRHLLLIVPASLRKQWAQELHEKFSLPSVILDAKRMKDLQKAGQDDRDQ